MGSSGHTSRHRKRKRASSTTASDASRDTTNARRPPPPALHQDVFHGLRICLTGHRDKRAHMAACVKRFGGQWSPGLRRDVDVLIAEHAGGDKYAWARKWGVAVVERRWYMDSMARGCAVGVERYRLAAPSVGAAEGEESGTASARARVLERGDAAPPAAKRPRVCDPQQAAQAHETVQHLHEPAVAVQPVLPGEPEPVCDGGGGTSTAASTVIPLDDDARATGGPHDQSQHHAPPHRGHKALTRLGSGYTPPPSSGTVAKHRPMRPLVTASGSFAALQPHAEDDTDVDDDALLDSFDHGDDPFKTFDDVKPETTPAAESRHDRPSMEEQHPSPKASAMPKQVEMLKSAPQAHSQATQTSTSTFGVDSTLFWEDVIVDIESAEEKAKADPERATQAEVARADTVVPDPPQQISWSLSRAAIPEGAKKVYAVRRGHRPDFYFDWYGADGAEAQTLGVAGALHKGFKTSSPTCCEDAMFFMNHGPEECGRGGGRLGKCSPPCRPVEIEYRTLNGPATSSDQKADEPKKPLCRICQISPLHGGGLVCASCASAPRAEVTFRQAIQEFNLQPEQLRILQYASQGYNVFYTGAAGTGKSTILRALMQFFRMHVHPFEVISPTGITALNVGGRTIHSFAAWGGNVDQKPLKNVRRDAGKDRTWRRLRGVKTIIIDEISMVSSNTLIRLDAVMKRVSHEELPFGGVQVIITGDFFQLPPVKPFHHCLYCGRPTKVNIQKKRLRKCLGDDNIFDDNHKWAFACPEWDELELRCLELTTVHRQADHDFATLLNKCRLGVSLSGPEEDLLLHGGSMVDENAIKIFSHHADVASLNATKLAELPTNEFTFWCVDHSRWNGNEKDWELYELDRLFEMTDRGTFRCWDEERHRYEEDFHLKKGMPVILLTNLLWEHGLVNGSQGVIVDFEPYDADTLPRANANGRKTPSLDPWVFYGDYPRYQETEVARFCHRFDDPGRILWPIVQFKNGRRCTIYPMCDVTEVGPEEPYSIMSRTQIPLLAAWAITTHKSQGMTLDQARIDMSAAWEYGQCYTAMSRVRSLDGLKVSGRGSGRAAGADEAVKEFMAKTRWER